MIDIEKCSTCRHVCPLTAQGLGEAAINAIAMAGTQNNLVACQAGPEMMTGGWQRCGAPFAAQDALRGAAQLVELQQIETASEHYVTV